MTSARWRAKAADQQPAMRWRSLASLSAEQNENLRARFRADVGGLFSASPVAQPRTTISDAEIWDMASKIYRR